MHVIEPGIITLRGRKDFTGVIKILRSGDYSVIQGPYKGKKWGVREGNVQ